MLTMFRLCFGEAKLNPPREHMYRSSVTKGCVCCETLGEESNGSTINGQVHLDNANGVSVDQVKL